MAARKSYARRAPAADEGDVAGDARRVTMGGIIAIGVDTVLNAGGMWTYVMGLNNTDSYEMFVKSLGASGDMRGIPALLIALALGLVLSIAPHKLWHRSGFGGTQETRRRIAAIVAGAGGWVTTWLFIQAVGLRGPVGLVVSLAIEWLLFEFKREVLR
jgi:hypothetical protein